jgi:hypothetical protein
MLVRRRWAVSDAPWVAGAMALSLIIAVIVLKLWYADLSVPIFRNYSDGTLTLASMKGVIEHGWYETNPTLGAPFGQVNHDYPIYIGELWNVLIVKTLALFSANVALVMNGFILISFPLIALTAFLVMRKFGLSRLISLICAVLFAVAPYHFVRAQADLFLGNYFGIPLSAYLILSILGAESLFTRGRWGTLGPRLATRFTSWLSGRTLTTVGIALIVGGAGLYYAAFTCLLIVIGAVVVGLSTRRWNTPLSGLVVVLAIAVPVVATALPEISYRSAHGTNHVVANRKPVESIELGLQPIQLVLPIPGNRIGPLARLRARYDAGQGTPGTQFPLPPADSLGLVGAVGLLWLLFCAIAAGAGYKIREPLARRGGTAALMAILLGVIGGGGALFAYLVTPEIRGWERIAVLIGFFALIGVGLLMERARSVLAERRWGRSLTVAVLLVILVFGVFDGTSSQFVPPYRHYSSEWHADAEFVGQIQQSLPRNAMVLELPYVPYPEVALPSGLTSYSLLEPYLHSSTLRWSGGAMAGRPTDWLALSSVKPLDQLIRGSVAAGFSGLYIDRAGYPDGGRSLATQVEAITDAGPIAEPDGRAYFFNLLAYAARLRATVPRATLATEASETVSPVSLLFGRGFYSGENGEGKTWHWAKSRASVRLTSARSQRVILSGLLAPGAPGSWRTYIRLPDGRVITLPVSTSGTLLHTTVTLRQGTSTIQFQTEAPAVPHVPRDLHLQVLNLSVES